MSEPEEDILAAMKAQFGEAETEEYLRLQKAIRYLIHAWGHYSETEDGSAEEAEAYANIVSMMDDVRSHPEHATAIVEGLTAIVVHLIKGGSIEEWFDRSGVGWMP